MATLDHLAGGGRVLLGIGVGWLAEEFAALGVSFDDRGARTDEYVAAMRALWSQERASFQGRFVQFENVFCRPLPPDRRIPIIVGGDTRAPRPAERVDSATAISPRARAGRAAGRDAPRRRSGRPRPADIELTVAAPAGPC